MVFWCVVYHVYDVLLMITSTEYKISLQRHVLCHVSLITSLDFARTLE